MLGCLWLRAFFKIVIKWQHCVKKKQSLQATGKGAKTTKTHFDKINVF